jgi:serine protease Do
MALPTSGGAQIAGLSQPPAERPVVPSDTGSAREVLARVRPAVIQIKGFFGLNTAQAFHGTGFAAAPGGLFMTNYHVVSSHVQHPGKYRLEFRTPDGKTGGVEVLAVDVRHDLAVVRAEGYAPEPLVLDPSAPAKGDRAYSVGFPLDVGLTITEGVSNGKVEDSFGPRIHYSGALNSGMSGGPALSAAGKVIGINVSGYLFQQSVAFLVPAEHALALRERTPAGKVETAALHKEIQEQMRAHSRDLLTALADPMPTQTVAGYTLPAKLAPFIDCNAAGNPSSDDPVSRVQINCLAKAGLYMQQGLTTGDIRYSHFVLQTAKLDAWRFTARLSSLTHATGQRGSRQHVGKFACQDRVVALKGFDASLLVCTRGYRKYDGLYDFVVRVSSLDGATRGFASHLDMFGLEFDAGMAFVRRYVEAMEWKP